MERVVFVVFGVVVPVLLWATFHVAWRVELTS